MKEGHEARLTFLVLLSGIFLCQISYGQPPQVVMEFHFAQPEIVKNVFTYGDVTYDSVRVKSLDVYGAPGKPIMPFKTVKVLLPQGGNLESIQVSTGKKITLDGRYTIEYGKPVISKVFKPHLIREAKPDNEIYSSMSPFPDTLYARLPLQNFRGYKILIVNLYPVQYIPKQGSLSYFQDMIVKVNLKPTVKISPLFRNLAKDRAEVIRKVDNADMVDTYTHKLEGPHKGCICDPSESYDYVIITNNALKNSSGDYTFQDLVVHKAQKGIQATIVTVEEIEADPDYRWNGMYGDGSPFFDDTAAHIRNFIKDAHNNWEIEYVLLGGDGDGFKFVGESETEDPIIPARRLFAYDYRPPGHPNPNPNDNQIASDLYYAALGGSWNNDEDDYWGEYQFPEEADFLAEVYIGRAPVDSEQEVSNFVIKTITYENSNDPYLEESWMAAEHLGWGGESEFGRDSKEEIRLGSDKWNYSTVGFPQCINVGTLYDFEWGYPPGWPKGQMITIINDGTQLINHAGHNSTLYAMKLCNAQFDEGWGPYCGQSGFTDVDDLTNTKYCFIYSWGCYSGSFDNWHYSYPESEDPPVPAYAGGYTKNDSIGEHFVTSAHGAFAVILNSRYGQGAWNSTNSASQRYDREFWDAVFGERITKLGKANEDSKEDNIGLVNQDAYRWCYYTLNLLGDPTLELPLPADRLVGWWKFDEGTGQIANDSVGNNDGQLGTQDPEPPDVRSPSWMNDQIHGWCLDFDVDAGEEDYVFLDPICALKGKNVTVSAWIWADDVSAGYHPVVAQYKHEGSNYEGYLLYVKNDVPRFFLGGANPAVSGVTIDAGEWYHLTGTNDGSELKIYVDGVEEGSSSSSGHTGINHDAYIGYDGDGSYFEGIIDDVHVYNYALDVFEIWDAMSGDAPRFRVKNSSDETVAWFDSFGNLFLKGSLTKGGGQTRPTATGDDEFIFKDSIGNLMIINTTNGNMDIYGEYPVDVWPGPSELEDEFVIEGPTGAVAYINASGNLYLKGELYQNPEP